MDALLKGDRALILQTLNSPSLAIRGVQDENVDYYVQRLDELKDIKQVEHWKLKSLFIKLKIYSNWTISTFLAYFCVCKSRITIAMKWWP